MTPDGRAWHTAYVGIGANIGDVPAQLAEAIDRLANAPGVQVTKVSSTLVNPPWGVTDQPPFNNLVVEIETELAALNLLRACQAIETEMGRRRERHWGPRVIDLDIIAYDREIVDHPDLILPHPYAAHRNFVMSPLREIAPDVAKWIRQRAEQPD